MFEKAVIYATNAHNGQTRKGTNLPFIIHPMEVAAIVAAMTLDQDMLCAAVLHDVVEDCDVISRSSSSLMWRMSLEVIPSGGFSMYFLRSSSISGFMVFSSFERIISQNP